MFQNLSQRLSDVFSKLTRKGALTEEDVNTALREVRVALLEADVALPVVKEFVESVKVKAVGQEVIRSISPGQMVIKIVNDHLVELLGGASEGLDLAAAPPVVVMMVGLQGSGKTTSSGKLALRLNSKHRKKTLLTSLDVHRPAAQEQLAVVAKQAGVESLPIIAGQKPLEITERALKEARLGGFDVLILDTAGRLHIDEQLMEELAAVRDLAKPKETLLVADSLTGQDAVNVARQFNEKIGVTGIVLTRIDGDGRGGAALSMRQVTGKPIKFLGTGEKLDGFEEFHPDRVASRILGMGDIVSLVEKTMETIDKAEAEKVAVKALEGQFDLDDMAAQFKQLKKMGGLGGMLNMLPGMGKMKQQLEGANIDEKLLTRQEAIISSMTKQERKHPKLLNGSRRRRIALGAGVEVQDVNRLLKQHQQMADMMKKVKKMGKKGLLRGGLKGLLPGMGG